MKDAMFEPNLKMEFGESIQKTEGLSICSIKMLVVNNINGKCRVISFLLWLQMMFSIDMLNTKVVDNFLILVVLKFHDFRPTSLGVIDFTSLLSTFAYAMNRSE